MPTEIEVAAVGRDVRRFLPLRSFYGGFFDDDENTRPWSERRRATLTVDDDEPMGTIVDRAVEAFDLFERDWIKFEEWRPPEGEPVFGTGRFIALRDDASPLPLVERLSQTVNLVDQDGHAKWWVGFQGATYAEIRAAAGAGALHGDPTQIYVNVRPTPAGGMFLFEWEFILEVWKVALGVAGTLAVANELHDLYGKVRDRLAGSAIVEGKTEEWLRRNGHADFLEHMLRGEPWSAFKLAGLLGCTVDEAGKILALYGYDEREPGSWVYVAGNEVLGLPSSDLSARVVRAYMNEARFRYASSAVPEGELALLFEEVIRHAAEQGDVPDLPHEEYYRKEEMPYDDANG